jgi:hypothetical protein
LRARITFGALGSRRTAWTSDAPLHARFVLAAGFVGRDESGQPGRVAIAIKSDTGVDDAVRTGNLALGRQDDRLSRECANDRDASTDRGDE